MRSQPEIANDLAEAEAVDNHLQRLLDETKGNYPFGSPQTVYSKG